MVIAVDSIVLQHPARQGTLRFIRAVLLVT